MHTLVNRHLQKKAKLYRRAKDRLNLLGLLVSTAYLVILTCSGFSGRAAALAAPFPRPAAVALYMLTFAPLWVILFPISYGRDYVVERRFALTSRSVRSWLLDEVKAAALGMVFGYPLLLFLFFLFGRFPRAWWALAACGLSAVQLFTTIIFPVLLFPFFFRQERIESGDLRDTISALLERAGIEFSGIYRFNLSAKSNRENATLAGFWKTRRVLLADTLLARRTVDEICVVVAHELGHHLKRHTIKLAALELAASFTLFFVLDRIGRLFGGFPEDFATTLSLVPVLVLAAGAVSFALRVLGNLYSRLKEREADAFALDLTGNPGAFVRLMAGLANTNLSVAYPAKVRKILFYSHPPAGERIASAEIRNALR